MDPRVEEFAGTTQELLAGIISRPKVSPQLLAKPPVNFIRDVFVEVSLATGCGAGLFSREEIDNMLSSRERNLAFLTMLLHFVAIAVDEPSLPNKVRVEKITAGLEPESTNLLLQSLCRAATDEACMGRWQGAIRNARQIWETTRAAVMASAQYCADESFYAGSALLPTPKAFRVAPLARKPSDGGAQPPTTPPPALRSGRRLRTMPAVSDPVAQHEMAASLSLAAQLHSRGSGSGAGGRVHSGCEPAVRGEAEQETDAQQHWRKLLRAHGVGGGGGSDEAALSRLAAQAARLQRAAAQLRETAAECGLPEGLSEADLGRLVLGVVWPGALVVAAAPSRAAASAPASGGGGGGRQKGSPQAPQLQPPSPAEPEAEYSRGWQPPPPSPASPPLGGDLPSVYLPPQFGAPESGGDEESRISSNLCPRAGAASADHGRALYHAKAGVLFEHVNCHPSEHYVMEDKLGQGSFGCVRRGVHRMNSTARAIKTIPKNMVDGGSLWSEIEIMRQLDHPHIMKLYGTFEDASSIFMTFELCSGGQLFDAITKVGSLCERTSARLMKQILAAVCYIHQRSIAHRDLKPENFMLAAEAPLEDAHIKLIDFGTAKRFDLEDLTTKVCTVHYVAPELLKSKPVPYDEKCDVWSCGVILYVMLAGTAPFDGQDDMEVLKKIKKGKFNFRPKRTWDRISDDARRMVSAMICVPVKDRFSAEQAGKDQWFQDFAPAAKNINLANGKVISQMRTFNAYNKLKRCALQVIAQNLPDDCMEKLRQVFLALDHDMKGALSVDQVEQEIQGLDCDAAIKLDLKNMVHEIADDSGEINYTQFLAANMDKQKYIQEEACRAAFVLFDVDGDGLITRDDLAAVFSHEAPAEQEGTDAAAPRRRGSVGSGRQRPPTISDGDDQKAFSDEKKRTLGDSASELLGVERGEIERVMLEGDVDGDGVICFSEFVKMLAPKSVTSRQASRRPSSWSECPETQPQIPKLIVPLVDVPRENEEVLQPIRRSRTRLLSRSLALPSAVQAKLAADVEELHNQGNGDEEEVVRPIQRSRTTLLTRSTAATPVPTAGGGAAEERASD